MDIIIENLSNLFNKYNKLIKIFFNYLKPNKIEYKNVIKHIDLKNINVLDYKKDDVSFDLLLWSGTATLNDDLKLLENEYNLPPKAILQQICDYEFINNFIHLISTPKHISQANTHFTALFPIITEGDGNCFPSAICFNLTGIFCSKISNKLRILASQNSNNEYFKKIFIKEEKKEFSRINTNLDEAALNKEFEKAVKENSVSKNWFNSLGIAAMSVTIARVIIILGNNAIDYGGTSTTGFIPNYLRGIYVPWALDPKIVKKNPPLFLLYNGLHFTPCLHFRKTQKNEPYPHMIRYSSLHDPLEFRYVPDNIKNPEEQFNSYVVSNGIFEFKTIETESESNTSNCQYITNYNINNLINNAINNAYKLSKKRKLN